MIVHGDFSIGKTQYHAGDDVPWQHIYPFFLFHMAVFGGSGFIMAYGDSRPDLVFLYMHGGIAISVYSVFYLVIFGLDEVKWMFLNALFGILGIYAQVGWLLTLFGRDINGYPLSVHVIPFLYFVLYSFLVRRAVIDLTHSQTDPARRKTMENRYIGVTLLINLACIGLQWLA